MRYLIIIMVLLSAFILYCCLRVGAEADRQMEEMWKDGGHGADGQSG